MIKKVNQETYKRLVSELLWERLEKQFWADAYDRQLGNTLWLLIISLLELGVIIAFILI